MKVIAFCHNEGCLGEIVLHGDSLQNIVRQPGIQRADRRRIAVKRDVCESINLINRYLHDITFLSSISG